MTQPTTATVLGALARERLFDLSRIFGAGLRASRQTKTQVAQLLEPTHSPTSLDGVPHDGQVLTARGRQWLVEAVTPGEHRESPLLRLACLDDARPHPRAAMGPRDRRQHRDP